MLWVGKGGWSNRPVQQHKLVSREMMEKRRKGQDTSLKGSLGRQLGEANLSTLSKAPHCIQSWPKKGNSHQSALSHSLSAPKEGVISCIALWAAQAPPMGCASSYLTPSPLPGGADQPELGWNRLVLMFPQQETWIQGSERAWRLSKSSSETRKSHGE